VKGVGVSTTVTLRVPLFPPEINFGVEGRENIHGKKRQSTQRKEKEVKSGCASRFFQTFRHFDLDAKSRQGSALEYHFDRRNEVTTLPRLIKRGAQVSDSIRNAPVNIIALILMKGSNLLYYLWII